MFRRIKSLVADSNPIEYYTVGALDIKRGQALKLVGNLLVTVTATETPEFIAIGDKEAGQTAGVQRVTELTEYETVTPVTIAETLVGSKVTLNANARTVTATTTNGVFTITQTDGVANGSTVRGFFRR